MDEQAGLVEVLRDVASAIHGALGFLFVFGVGIALVVMGNTLARLIGFGFLALGIYYAVRLAQRLRSQ